MMRMRSRYGRGELKFGENLFIRFQLIFVFHFSAILDVSNRWLDSVLEPCKVEKQ